MRILGSNRVASWLQAIANIGILGGLVLVGLQLKQNADLLRVQLVYEESERLVSTERALLGENAAAVVAKSLIHPLDLTLEERRIVEAYVYIPVEQWRAVARLSEEGLMLESDWKIRVRAEAAYVLGNPYGRGWWANFKNDNETLPKELVELVDAELMSNPNNTLEYHEGIVSETRKTLSLKDQEDR